MIWGMFLLVASVAGIAAAVTLSGIVVLWLMEVADDHFSGDDQ